jgi:hypothetical protein
MSSNVLLNSSLIELDRLNLSKDSTATLAGVYDEASTKNNKFNSFPMRLKKVGGTGGGENGVTAKLRSEPKSSSSIEYKAATEEYVILTEEELNQTVRHAFIRAQENAKLKQILRNNYWSFKHPIRNYLWKCLLKQASSSSQVNTTNSLNGGDKENNLKNEVYCNEADYNNHLNQIFGKCKLIKKQLKKEI